MTRRRIQKVTLQVVEVAVELQTGLEVEQACSCREFEDSFCPRSFGCALDETSLDRYANASLATRRQKDVENEQ